MFALYNFGRGNAHLYIWHTSQNWLSHTICSHRTHTAQSNTKFQFSRGIPEGCVQSECDYFVGINPNMMNENLLEFTLEGNARGWLAVGFSKTPSMVRMQSCFKISSCRCFPLSLNQLFNSLQLNDYGILLPNIQLPSSPNCCTNSMCLVQSPCRSCSIHKHSHSPTTGTLTQCCSIQLMCWDVTDTPVGLSPSLTRGTPTISSITS